MAVEDIDTKIAQAVAAHEAGDTTTALLKLRSARMLMTGLPDMTRAGGAGMRWDRAAVDAMIADLEQSRAAGLGIQTTKIRYKRVGCDDE
jgi:hypothetical protein